MAEEQITCTECGHTIPLGRAREEPHAGCPICGSPWAQLIDREFGNKELKLRDNKSLSDEHKTCPSCLKLSPNANRICVHCGYDWQTGKTRETIFQRKIKLRAYLPSVVLVVLIAGGGFWFYRQAGSTPKKAQEIAAPAGPTIEDLQREDFNAWKTDFDSSSPVLRQGERAKLELLSGRMIRAQIQSIRPSSIIIVSELGQEEISFDALAPTSRAQLDPDFRSSLVDKARERIFAP